MGYETCNDPNCKGACNDPFCDAPGFPTAPKPPTCEEIEAAWIARRATMTEDERMIEDDASQRAEDDALCAWIERSHARGIFV